MKKTTINLGPLVKILQVLVDLANVFQTLLKGISIDCLEKNQMNGKSQSKEEYKLYKNIADLETKINKFGRQRKRGLNDYEK